METAVLRVSLSRRISPAVAVVAMGRTRYDWDRIVPWLADAVERETAYVGQPPTLRRGHYLIVKEPSLRGSGYLNDKQSYGSLKKKIARLREDGLFPDLDDVTRRITEPPRYDDLAGALEHLRRSLWLDRTHDVPVMVAVEKDTLLPLVRSRFWWLPTTSMRGYTGVTHARRVAAEVGERGLVVLYVGDFDPSGLHMSDEDLPRRTGLHFHRVAVTAAQVAALPDDPDPAKENDARLAWMRQQYGRVIQVEAEALEPEDIVADLAAAITRHTGVTLDADRLPVLPGIVAKENDARDRLDRIVADVRGGGAL